jgi:hypothetical protein
LNELLATVQLNETMALFDDLGRAGLSGKTQILVPVLLVG